MSVLINGNGTINGVTTQDGLAIGGPAFSVYATANQSVTSSTATKVLMTGVEFDTAGAWSTANSRFQPTVAGYYRVNGTVRVTGVTGSMYCEVWKNGAIWKRGQECGAAQLAQTSVDALVLLNGTTDYVEFSVVLIGTTPSLVNAGGQFTSFFQGFMVRPT